MSNEEATVNTDGSATFETPSPDTGAGGGFESPIPGPEETFGGDSTPPPVMDGAEEDIFGAAGAEKAAAGGIDPAFYLLFGFLIVAALYYYFFIVRKKDDTQDDFFSELEGEKFNLKLPAEVDEYYKIKSKCEAAGWEPGTGPPVGANGQPSANGPHRVLAQALMKRAIADIPLVQFMQKESQGMGKLYSKSMCSVKQWRSYQAAEAMVAAEVDEVRAEADEIEPGWSDVIWRQAMQYHNMLKQKHEMEAKAAQEKAKKIENNSGGGGNNNITGTKSAINSGKPSGGAPVDDVKAREIAAQRAAEELIKEEEREKQAKKAFSGGVKKGKKK